MRPSRLVIFFFVLLSILPVTGCGPGSRGDDASGDDDTGELATVLCDFSVSESILVHDLHGSLISETPCSGWAVVEIVPGGAVSVVSPEAFPGPKMRTVFVVQPGQVIEFPVFEPRIEPSAFAGAGAHFVFPAVPDGAEASIRFTVGGCSLAYGEGTSTTSLTMSVGGCPATGLIPRATLPERSHFSISGPFGITELIDHTIVMPAWRTDWAYVPASTSNSRGTLIGDVVLFDAADAPYDQVLFDLPDEGPNSPLRFVPIDHQRWASYAFVNSTNETLVRTERRYRGVAGAMESLDFDFAVELLPAIESLSFDEELRTLHWEAETPLEADLQSAEILWQDDGSDTWSFWWSYQAPGSIRDVEMPFLPPSVVGPPEPNSVAVRSRIVLTESEGVDGWANVVSSWPEMSYVHQGSQRPTVRQSEALQK